ncbi:hypothetical protein QP775_04995 [Paenibacillus sp. UMB4589-SE434]|nr:hypothetical protein [Paenibacillus sp. UMB4589-SE434]
MLRLPSGELIVTVRSYSWKPSSGVLEGVDHFALTPLDSLTHLDL